MNVKIDPTWQQVLQGEFDAPYFADLARFVHQEYRQGPCYPPAAAIFNAFNLCPFDRVKVVILGQRWEYHIPRRLQRIHRSVSFYYELSTCDLYVVSAIPNRRVGLTDILSLCAGIRWDIF